MKRALSRRSDISEPEIDGAAEAELSKLQRQYRIMEGDRKAYNEETQNIIRKQKTEIEALQNEKDDITTDLKLAQSKDNAKKDRDNTRQLENLIQREDEYDALLEIEKEKIADLDMKIREWEKKVSQQNKTMGGVNNGQETHIATQKNIRVLENRLDQATIRFNTLLTKNAELRSTIDHLRQERSLFDSLYKRLSRELGDGRKEIVSVIETATQAYDSRDEAQSKITSLTERSEKDQLQYNAELKELLRILDHDQKLKDFMAAKAQERSEYKAEEAAKRKKRGKGAEKDHDSHEETVTSFEEAFSRIQEITGEEDVEVIVEKFLETEDKNFALYNYVNELNSEIEVLQDQIAAVNADIDAFKKQGIALEKQRQAVMKSLEEKLAVATKDADKSERSLKKTSKVLDQIKSGVESLFNKVNCDKTAITEMLGGSGGISDRNLMQYLGIIEQRTNELLRLKQYLKMKETITTEPKPQPPAQPQKTASVSVPLTKPAVAAIVICPPSTGSEEEEFDMDIDDTRPLTQDEIRKRIMRTIARKEATSKRPAVNEKNQSLNNEYDKKK
ncbi:coiled-coil domain-containing protein 63-like [Ptychodera flava]|uniref:coiled-coil domain-containing protein 63-like n=1 Tax=Ptychodera flava TaxID=63121 RepID=UPI00396A9772